MMTQTTTTANYEVKSVGVYQFRALVTGRPVRKATVVTFADGREIQFMDRIPKRLAIRQAIALRTREDAA